MAVIYDKKLLQLLNIKFQNNKNPMIRCIYCIHVQGMGVSGLNLYNADEGRNVGRDVKYTDTTVVL